MKKCRKWIVFLLVMAVMLSGCGNSGQNANENQKTEKQDSSTALHK